LIASPYSIRRITSIFRLDDDILQPLVMLQIRGFGAFHGVETEQGKRRGCLLLIWGIRRVWVNLVEMKYDVMVITFLVEEFMQMLA
jgi:hypothetical protein